MRRRRAAVLAPALGWGVWVATPLASIGCAQFDTGASARRAAAALLECDEEQVQMAQLGAYRYRGAGCGREVTVACTAAALEPECLRESAGAATAGGHAEGAASPPAEPDEPPALDEQPQPEVEAAIRAGLDARRDDILACAGQLRVAVRAGYAPDGSVAFSLQGELSGSPEERCVQDALDGVRVPATGGAGVVVHLIR